MSYFRAQKARKTSPRSISSRLDSTQKVSRKRGRVTLRSVPFSECLIFGVQSTQDVYIVAYYNTGVTSLNTSSPGGVQLINPGTSGGTLCADVYVFDPAEELKECALPISTDGGLFLALDGFTDNPANGVYSATGVIKIVSDATCNPFNPVPTPELRGSIFNVNNPSITETPFQQTPIRALGPAEASASAGRVTKARFT